MPIPIQKLLAAGEPLPLPLTLEIARQGLHAVESVHHRGEAHRGISTESLGLSCDAAGRLLAHLSDPLPAVEGQRTLSASSEGVLLADFKYGAPETFDDAAGFDRRHSDLYSFGLVLYELLTGVFPIIGNSPSSLIAGHLFRPPLAFAESDPSGQVPEVVRRVVLQALAKSPDERFADAASFAAALPSAPEVDWQALEVRRIVDFVRALESAPEADPEATVVLRREETGETALIEPPVFDGVPPDGVPSEQTPATDTGVSPRLVAEPAQQTSVIKPGISGSPASVTEIDTAATRILEAESLPVPEPPASVTEIDTAATRVLDAETLRQIRQEAAQASNVSLSDDESTVLLSPGAAPAQGPEDLEQAVAEIRRLRDEGRAGEALKELDRIVRRVGQVPVLQTLRYELGEALLERDAEEEESASRRFEVVAEPPGQVPTPPTRRGIELVPDPPPSVEPAPPAESVAAEPLHRGLDDATIRSIDGALPPPPERPEPPVAHGSRNMVVAGLLLAAVFAVVGYFLLRQGRANEPALQPQDVEAQAMSPGTLILDAVPWAEIVDLENPFLDEAPTISPSRFTPVVLELPPGEYRMTFVYPPTGQLEERILQVDSDQLVEERVVFQQLDADRYFEQVGW